MDHTVWWRLKTSDTCTHCTIHWYDDFRIQFQCRLTIYRKRNTLDFRFHFGFLVSMFFFQFDVMSTRRTEAIHCLYVLTLWFPYQFNGKNSNAIAFILDWNNWKRNMCDQENDNDNNYMANKWWQMHWVIYYNAIKMKTNVSIISCLRLKLYIETDLRQCALEPGTQYAIILMNIIKIRLVFTIFSHTWKHLCI